MPKPVIAGLYYGGVNHFIAPDGRPMVTGIRKRPAATGFLGTKGFPDDASAEPAHHTQDKTVHLFSNENYRLLEARLGVVLPRPTFGENVLAIRELSTEGKKRVEVMRGRLRRGEPLSSNLV